jgi:hypothetical protein
MSVSALKKFFRIAGSQIIWNWSASAERLRMRIWTTTVSLWSNIGAGVRKNFTIAPYYRRGFDCHGIFTGPHVQGSAVRC